MRSASQKRHEYVQAGGPDTLTRPILFMVLDAGFSHSRPAEGIIRQAGQSIDQSQPAIKTRSHLVKRTAQVLLLCTLTAFSVSLRAQEVPGCGMLQNAFGPFDYRDPVVKRERLAMVETYHFTPDVESLRGGYTGGSPLRDLAYTLRVFPNHPRALAAMARYVYTGRPSTDDPTVLSADCYFARAIVFAPDDEAVRVIYADYLYRMKQPEKARAQYEEALRLAPESVDVNYAAGLFFVAIGELDRAKQLAEVAYGGGYPLTGLKKKIAAAETVGAKQKK